MIIRLYCAACDTCNNQLPDGIRHSTRAARRAATRAGWTKRGRKRDCPACIETNGGNPAA